MLDYLREDHGLKGTKEGCNEGDCGACSVIVTGSDGVPRAVNACITFLPSLQGKSVRTVEGVAAPDGRLHPVQQAMIDHHGSQCGFCTPGFITTMAAAHAKGETDFDTALAGNLCRCTGYAPIIRAATAAVDAPVPDWIAETPTGGVPRSSDNIFCPTTLDQLAQWRIDHPDGTLIAGATDIGLWVTKHLRTPQPIAFLGYIDEMRGISQTGTAWHIGAMTTIADMLDVLGPDHPSLADMLKRYGSPQVRNSATIGGNIANGSPIGDAPPALIAMGATLHLRRGGEMREIALEDFFLGYKKQDLRTGEFVSGVTVPKGQDALRCYKLSKRFDQDISAVCGCLNIEQVDGVITQARVAFGGMAATPKRATHVEQALLGSSWSEQNFMRAAEQIVHEFTPMSDMRASAGYRSQTAANMLRRYYLDLSDHAPHVREVQP